MHLSNAYSRRHLLQQSACGFGYLALAGLCAQRAVAETAAAANPLAPRTPHFAPRAKRAIFIFMQGGPSHVDTFDYKPKLQADDGKKFHFDNLRTRAVNTEQVFASPWKFKRHGECGQWVSELFPHMARHVDDMCFIRSMHTEGVAHGPATLFLHTGALNLVRPSMGAWISYGLGTENENLPSSPSIPRSPRAVPATTATPSSPLSTREPPSAAPAAHPARPASATSPTTALMPTPSANSSTFWPS
jgi:hypothetical protein